jgi:protein-L-isoaspartate(D-aspartate) O-methyltransferase
MDQFEIPRRRMVEHLRTHYKIQDERVLTAMGQIPRHLFVPDALRSQAYKDNALPISNGQTISQPFIVAKMTELLELKGTERVLEIGGGSGYQTAVLSVLARKIYVVERIQALADELKERILRLGFRNVSIRANDGTNGWQIYSPFDRVLVAAGGPDVPEPLIDQLDIGGILVIPLGENKREQRLTRIKKKEDGIETEDFGPCSFVPLVGKHGWNSGS